MSQSTGSKSRTPLIVGLVVGALVVGGGAAAAITAPSWLPNPAPQSANSPSESGSSGSANGSSQSPTETKAAVPYSLAVTPVTGASSVNPATAPTIKVTNGTVKDVSLVAVSSLAGKPVTEAAKAADTDLGTVTASTTPIAGDFAADNTSWKATARLAFDTNYRLDYTVVDGAGKTETKSSTFSTVPAAKEANTILTIGSLTNTIGSAQPIQIEFSEPVVNREAVKKALTVSVNSGQKLGWRWYSDKLVRIRPETFWKAGSTITINQQLFGVDFGNGQIGNFNKTLNLTVGPQRVAVVDNNTKQMVVYIDGKVAHTAPVTLGDEEWPSPQGYSVIMEQQRVSHFRAESIGLKPGDAKYYKPVDVNYANRLTPTGEYVHQALDSAFPYIGNTNVSHGCIGLLPADAAWFFNNMKPGDVVQVKNTGAAPIEPLEGFGDWNIPWAKYPMG